MSRDRIVRIEMTAVALTPVHVGDGTDWTPEAYDLRGGRLCRFEPARVLSAMGANARGRYVAALDRGDLKGAQNELRRAAGDDAIGERIAVSGASQRAVEEAFHNPARSGEIKPFVRSGGMPYLPGSSLKGAFRTALASAFAAADGMRPSPPGVAYEQVTMRQALGLGADDTSSDPLRFLSLADVALPPDSTVVDKSEVFRPRDGRRDGGQSPRGIQMHVERIRCDTDGGGAPRFRFRLAIDTDGMARAARRGTVRRSFDRTALFDAVNDFHWDVWTRERQRFFAGEAKTCEAMDRILAGRRHADGSTVAQRGPKGRPDLLLLRIGRFGHFESKSLAGLRQGHVPQHRTWRRPDEFGSTRTVVRAGGAPIPFGWVLAWETPVPTLAAAAAVGAA